MRILEDLNDEQRRAAEAPDGPVVIVAGPGTGKTKTLTARIAYLVESGRAKPEQILALTFTKKAAEEMQNRLAAVMGSAAKRVKLTTFHSFCHELLGGETPFATEAERLQIIRSIPRPKALKEYSLREFALFISRAKNAVKAEDPAASKIVRAYNKALAAQGLRDFDDLLQDAYKLLKSDQKFRREVQARYSHILVDEFQDTNRLQYEILKLLLGNRNIFVIGDPNQSIYGFRGADGGIFERSEEDFGDACKITLHVNYRSAPEIVKLSNNIFGGEPLAAHVSKAGQARAVEVLNEYGEARWVLAEIHKAIGGGDFLNAVSDDARSNQRSLNEFAVLYRSRSAASVLQKLLDESGLPYQVVGDGSPYDKPEVQAIIALLSSAVSKQPVALDGYSSNERRYLGEQLDKAEEALPSALAERIIGILGLEPSRELQQFVSTIVRFKTVPDAVKYFGQIAENGFYDPAADAITLLTIHASKGLEFPHVFLIGAEEGILPSARAEEAEEKRLFYVAATRAREHLQVLYARNRGVQKAEVSRFVKSLPAEALYRHADPEMQSQARRLAKRAARNSQTTLF